MHNDQHNYDLCLQAINERVKSECLLLLPQEHDAVKSIQAEPYGHLTPVTLGIIARALTQPMALHQPLLFIVLQVINGKFNERLTMLVRWRC